MLFKKMDEDPIMVAKTLATLTKAIAHNILVLNEKVMEDE